MKNRLKVLRAMNDWSQQDLAERVGVRRQTILAIEKGHYIPSALLAFQIAKAFAMGVEELFELDGDEETLR